MTFAIDTVMMTTTTRCRCSLGIDVGKKKCRAALKDEGEDIIREFFFNNNNEGISALIQSASRYGKCTAVVEWHIGMS
jgi:transposase